MSFPLTIAEAAAALRGHQLTSVQLTEHALARIHALDQRVGAFIVVSEAQALAAARAADADFASGVDRGPLQGIPFGLKDLLATHDAPTTANSVVLDPAWGDGYDAVVVERVRAEGAVLMGKLVMSEFATGGPDAKKEFPIPRNPWDLDRSPAGSSSGTGIAVVTGMVLGGLGTDTGGSVRGPAAANGLSGLKVTYGRVPKWGCVPLSYTLDSIGPMARSAYDCALILNTIAGFDSRDPTSSRTAVEDYTAGIGDGVRGLRIGVPREFFFDSPQLHSEMRVGTEALIATLVEQGAEATEVRLPRVELARDAYSITMMSEAFAYHHMDMTTGRWGDYGAPTRETIARGALYTGADYVQAQRYRAWFGKQVARVMAGIDVLITPSGTEAAQPGGRVDPLRRFTNPSFTGPFNLLGYPALAVPAGVSTDGMPLSAQIVGAPFAESTVLRVGHAWQQLTDWHLRVPPMAEAVSTG